ncbi:MAG TPA: cysteine hydrolase family protein [Anaerolineales bacterium]
MNNTAFLVIDVQVNMFAEGRAVFNGEKMLLIIRQLITQARAAHLPVIYVQNNGGEGDPDMTGTAGWQIHPDVTPEMGDIIIQKHTPDSFFKTNLQNELGARHIRHLIIAGMQTEFCINATCHRAHDLGYEVTLVQDAHSTYDGKGLTASQIITRYNHELQKKVNLKEAKDIPFG